MGHKLASVVLLGTIPLLLGRAAAEESVARPDPAHPSKFEQPNIIVVYTDDQRWDSLEYMPAVSRMADEGVLFVNSFVTTPVCGPSRASLLTGRLASTQGITLNEGASGQFDPRHTIAVKLRERGYVTALYGKYMNGYRDQFPKVPPGWSDWRAMRDRYGDLFSAKSLYVDPVLSWNGEVRRTTGYSTDLLAEYAVDFIEENAEKRFFLLLSLWAPHVPLSPAERHEGLLAGRAPEKPPNFEEVNPSEKPAFIRKSVGSPDLDPIWDVAFPRYLETLMSVDEAVATIRSKLEELELDENTIVVFTSDNGFMFGEHWTVGKGVPYEESIRVPLVVWNPRLRHREVDEMVLNIDIAPTLAELAGTEIEADGESLVPFIYGSDPPWRWTFEIEGEEVFGERSYRAVRSRFFKYIQWSVGHRELYVLPLDPFEVKGFGFGTGAD